LALLAVAPAAAQDLRTVAESSEFRATARHAEVVALCRALAEASPRIHHHRLGTSSEGRELPLLLIAEPPVCEPEDARRSGKPVVLLIGAIHGGEVCGKEALLMLARDLGQAAEAPLLKDLILAVVPLLNADGNERIDPQHRPEQGGPEGGVGAREDAQGLDLNRDFIKLETPEVRAVAAFLNAWDPIAVIDTHATNGSHHRFAITYDGPKHPAGDPRILDYVRDSLLKDVTARLEREQGLRSYFYGNFDRERRRWETFPDLPRFSTTYVGLRNRLAVLVEAYAYSSFRDRVLNTREFVMACLDHLAGHRKGIEELIKTVDADAGRWPDAAEARRPIALKTRPAAGLKVEIPGFVEELRDGKRVPTGEPRDYEVDAVLRSEPELAAERAFAYVFPRSLEPIAGKLHAHGIRIEELREDLELPLQVYGVESLDRADEDYQGRRMAAIAAKARNERRRLEAGACVVRTSQALGALASYLLEPQAPDGLAAWGYLDSRLAAGGDFPVLRLPLSVPLLTAAIRDPGARPAPKTQLSFERVYESQRPPSLSARAASPERWLDDERYVLVKEGQRFQVEAATGEGSPLESADRAIEEALNRLPSIDASVPKRERERKDLRPKEDRQVAWYLVENDLYYAASDGSARRLTSTPEEEELPRFSPDGRFVAFIEDFDLHVVDVETAGARALTSGGNETVRHGKASWVYFEEVFDRDWRAYWWSPDSRRLAFLRFDSSAVEGFSVVDDLPRKQRVERDHYPRPGEPNPTAALGIVHVAGGDIRWADLSDYDAGDLLITGVGWTPDAQSVYVFIQNRIQSWLDLALVSKDGGKPRRLLRETTEAWVDAPLPPRFLDGGAFLLTSARSGWRHLYRFDKDGRLLNEVSSGPWELRALHGVDEKEGWAYLSGTRDSHVAENLYRVKLDGSAIERLTPEEGHHSVILSPSAAYFVDRWSSCGRPERAALRRSSGELVRWIDSNPAREIEDYVICPEERFRVAAAGGFEVDASLMKPPDFDPSRRYPVWLMTYGGPHAPTMQDRWIGTRLWDQVLAQSGIVVLRCDPRSASGKGAASTWSAYKRLGIQELEDIRAVVEWLREQPWVDAARIGMSGHSYGGFLTAFAMTHSDLFAAGIAGAPVTDWRLYDTIYTERYMQTPQLNAEGYAATSVVGAAEKLHGRLLLLHGAVDDNVHLQNTLQFAGALQRAGKQFELMVYPGSRHGIFGRHYQRLMYDFIRRTVGAAGSSPESDGALTE
jgi:dipeptidyl aminopeptidase/acylaminoacyl peptidase